jgi:hypothetical protein
MNLSKIKNDLQLVLQLVEDWSKNGVDAIERDIVLGKLRELYSDVRFGADPQPETISAEESVPAKEEQSAATEEPTPLISEQMPIGVAISLDDVFEGFIPEDLMPTSVAMPIEEEIKEEPAPETDIPVIEESAPEVVEQPEVVAEEILEPEPVAEEVAEPEVTEERVEPQLAVEPDVESAPEVAEPTPEPEAVEMESVPEVAEPTSEPEAVEMESASEVAESEPTPEPEPQPAVAESTPEPSMGQPSLFGDDELFAPRPSRRTRMMSLYDDEPRNEVVISKRATEPTPEPTTPEPKEVEVKPIPTQPVVPTQTDDISIEVLEEEDEFTEVDLATIPTEEHSTIQVEEPTMVEEVAPLAEATQPEPVKVESVEPYVEPQIEIAVATPAASAVPESEQVLGEVIKSNVQTIADTIKPKDTAAEKIAKGSVNDITKAVGINDRFLLIRDLFGGSSEEYDRVMTQLNSFDNLEDCMIHIVENYDWNPNSDGAKLIMELIERKYS